MQCISQNNLSHLFYLIGLGLSVAQRLKIYDFLNSVTVENVMVALPHPLDKLKPFQERDQVIK